MAPYRGHVRYNQLAHAWAPSMSARTKATNMPWLTRRSAVRTSDNFDPNTKQTSALASVPDCSLPSGGQELSDSSVLLMVKAKKFSLLKRDRVIELQKQSLSQRLTAAEAGHSGAGQTLELQVEQVKSWSSGDSQTLELQVEQVKRWSQVGGRLVGVTWASGGAGQTLELQVEQVKRWSFRWSRSNAGASGGADQTLELQVVQTECWRVQQQDKNVYLAGSRAAPPLASCFFPFSVLCLTVQWYDRHITGHHSVHICIRLDSRPTRPNWTMVVQPVSALLLTWAVLCLEPVSLDKDMSSIIAAENITCPLDCKCVPETTVNCAGAELMEFPHVSDKTLQLYLENNMINEVNVEHVSHLLLLETLNIQNNGLSSEGLEDEGLEMLEQLAFLYLANNNLTSAPRALPHSLVSADFTSNELARIYPYTFGYKPKLRSVYLHNNRLTDAGLPEHMFNGSNSLEILAMSSNLLTKVPRNLPSSLHQLHLKSNKLKEISEGAFENLSNLRELHLQDNLLSSEGIEPTTFSHLSSLEYLDLSNNNLSVVPSGLPKGLLMLHLEKNSIHTIPADSLSSLRSLEYLVIHNNKLRSRAIHPAAFQGLKKLHTLHMYNNLLERVPRGMPKRATTLMLLHNLISEIGRNDLAFLHTLTELNLSYNRLSSAKLHHEAFRKLRNLSTLDLSGNSLHLFPLGLPRSLQVLQINNNQLSSIPLGALSGSMAGAQLSHYVGSLWNLLSHIPPDLPESLEYLHLQNNRISAISASVFEATPNLKGLYLRLNRLTAASVDEGAFFLCLI
ncbi:hypothetical protein WMY93_024627 [Mugilogobius chulae]|uniref:LRRNT domain-containing protein n=1 Tax=Mugilogobius chulae TaxID=88201 RepID=A0AAW0N4P1_9GOBI